MFFLRFLLFSSLFCLISCNQGQTAQKPLLITSVPPLAFLIQDIAGTDFKVTTLLGKNASPHSFEPGAEEMRMIETASVYVKTGLGLELELILDKLVLPYPRIKSFTLAHLGKTTKSFQGHLHNQDPHLWVSPKRALALIQVIAAELSLLYPEKKELFTQNYHGMVTKLNALDQWVKDKTARWRNKKIVQMHPAWNYFAQDYGLEIIGTIQEHSGHEETVSLKDFQILSNKVKKAGAALLLMDPEKGQEAADKFSHNLGIPYIIIDSTGLNFFTYHDFIVSFVNQMEKGLK